MKSPEGQLVSSAVHGITEKLHFHKYSTNVAVNKKLETECLIFANPDATMAVIHLENGEAHRLLCGGNGSACSDATPLAWLGGWGEGGRVFAQQQPLLPQPLIFMALH